MFTTAIMMAALAAPAEAGVEAALEYGVLGAHDDSFDLFSDLDAIQSVGVRLGWQIDENLAVTGSWHRASNGGPVYTEFGSAGDYDEEYYYYDDDDDDDAQLHLALDTWQLSAGPRYAIPVNGWLAFYGDVQVQALRGRIRMDDDITADDNPNQLMFKDWSLGGAAALGAEFMPLRIGEKGRIGHDLEMGYAAHAPLHFTDGDHGDAPITDLTLRGFYLRMGLTARF